MTKQKVMSATTDSIKNYFDAIDRFYDSWYKMMKSTLSGVPNPGEAKRDFNQFANWMKDQMDDMEKMALKQQQYIENLSPEEYQKEVLASLKDFKKAYAESTQMVMDELKRQEEYVQSDQFLEDTKTTADRTAQVYNQMLGGFSEMVDTFTKTMEEEL